MEGKELDVSRCWKAVARMPNMEGEPRRHTLGCRIE